MTEIRLLILEIKKVGVGNEREMAEYEAIEYNW